MGRQTPPQKNATVGLPKSGYIKVTPCQDLGIRSSQEENGKTFDKPWKTSHHVRKPNVVTHFLGGCGHDVLFMGGRAGYVHFSIDDLILPHLLDSNVAWVGYEDSSVRSQYRFDTNAVVNHPISG